ncbi:MAG: class I SAM-dependent methyltransferase [bacterium]
MNADDRIGRTRRTYDDVAGRVVEATRTRGRIAARRERFAAALPAGALVLDAGCGPGDDAAALRVLGLCAVGLDLSLGLLRAGRDQFPGPRVQADLRCLPFAAGTFAGAWANASLLHLDPHQLIAALGELRRVLAAGALLHTAVKAGDGAAWESERYGAPRWFQYWRAESFDAQLADAGFRITAAETLVGERDTWLMRTCVAE